MNKMLIPIVVIISLLGGGGAYFISSRLSPSRAGQEAAAKHSVVAKTSTVELPEFIVNLADRDRPHYLKATMVLELFGGEGMEAVKTSPYVRDAILNTLGHQTYASLLTEEGKVKLKQELLECTQDTLEKQEIKVSSVMFTSFVMD